MNAVHPLQTSSRRWLPLQSAEWALLAAAVALLAFAVWGPFLPASAHQHDFADQRGLQGLPCARLFRGKSHRRLHTAPHLVLPPQEGSPP